jgi:pimeloyl-ACP methyl ester carboxylesterase
MVDSTRRKLLKTGAAATMIAAAPRALAEQGERGAGMSFYERGQVRIHYEEHGSGFPLLLIAGGGLNSTIAALANPFNPIAEFKGEYRCIASDLRNANGGQSSGPLEIDRPWDAFTDDHLGLMDHLGIDKVMVMGVWMRKR